MSYVQSALRALRSFLRRPETPASAPTQPPPSVKTFAAPKVVIPADDLFQRALFSVIAAARQVTSKPSVVFVLKMKNHETGEIEPVLTLGLQATDEAMQVIPMARMLTVEEARRLIPATDDEVVEAIETSSAAMDRLMDLARVDKEPTIVTDSLQVEAPTTLQ